jgi:ABC-2 type transport system ATP-binding protein
MNSRIPAVQIDDLTYRYGRAEAVSKLNLSVQPGRCYGLFGRNGAGKTTVVKCLLNLLRCSESSRRTAFHPWFDPCYLSPLWLSFPDFSRVRIYSDRFAPRARGFQPAPQSRNSSPSKFFL